jgi:hypothetical protein
MQTKRLLLTLWILLMAVSAPAAKAATHFAVIANADVPVDNLSLSDIRRIYLGDRQFWSGNLRVAPLVRAPVARERAMVVWNICKMSEAQFSKHWLSKVMRAETALLLRQFSNNQSGIELVKVVPGSIAIVNASQVPPGVRVIRIDGHAPGDAEYALQSPE